MFLESAKSSEDQTFVNSGAGMRKFWQQAHNYVLRKIRGKKNSFLGMHNHMCIRITGQFSTTIAPIPLVVSKPQMSNYKYIRQSAYT
jgi:hypothetical protein